MLRSVAKLLRAQSRGPCGRGCRIGVQLHPLTTVIFDQAAASQLQQPDYYRFAWENGLDFER